MSSQPIIEIRGIGKRYNLSHQRGGYVALRDVLTNIVRRPFRFLAQRAADGKKEAFWALRDVSFTVERGESIGVIGSNGAGKSTLLKIVTGITPPTEGEIIMRGRVASLLEVGTGFHPELSGRENIYLNGAILGMAKKEIEQKFEEIVAFAGVEKFLDTPVKYYSSGMYVRLAFSVAAHMEPDILLIDEVLAVGDAEFQKKCLGKMEEVTKKDGRTILFVSHNLAAVESLCKRTVLLEHGQVKMIGETKDVIDFYMRNKSVSAVTSKSVHLLTNGGGTLTFTDMRLTDTNGSLLIKSDSGLIIRLPYHSDFTTPIPDIRVLITIINQESRRAVLRLDSHVTSKSLGDAIAPTGEIVCETGPIDIDEGTYGMTVQILPQRSGGSQITLESEFEVVMDMESYSYTLPPDKQITDRLVRYSFRQTP